MQNFHISATGHSLNYLPQYVADWQGYFAEEGLVVTASVPEPWTQVLADIATGSAAAALGGIWVPSMYHARGRRLRPFAQLSNRAPLALISRPDAAPFAWGAMAGKWVSMKGSNGASVGLYFKMMLREQGVDPADVNFIQDLDGGILTDCFLGGMGDYLMIDAPSAQKLEAQGLARVEQLFSVTGGDIPWSVYYAEGEGTPQDWDLEHRFVRALQRGMDYVLAHPAADYGDFLSHTFPRFTREKLVALTETYRQIGMWTSTVIDPAGYARWQKGINDGGLTLQPLAYDELIDRRAFAA